MTKRRPKTILLKKKVKNKTLKPKEKFICHYSHCQKELTSKKILKYHLLIHTARERNFICSTCNKGFLHKHSLEKHETIHTRRKRPFSCENCKKRFLLKEHLTVHTVTCNQQIEKTSSSETNIHKCSICKRGYKSKRNVIHHMKTHEYRENKFKCSVCGKGFLHKYSRNLHEKTFHKDIPTVKKNPYWCRVQGCGKYLMSKKNLDKHKLTHKKTHKCSFCKRNFLTEEILREHENVHTTIHTVKKLTQEKAHVCKDCDLKFDSGEELLNHMVIHHNIKSAEILVISPNLYRKKSVRKSSKQNQQEKENKSSKQNQQEKENDVFDCNECDKNFKSKGSFNLHKIRHEKENKKVADINKKSTKISSKTTKRKDTSDKDTSSCPKCPKTFARKDNLAKHMKIHSKGGKMLACHICDKTFPNEVTLETHARIHLDVEESYLCSECLKIFASRANLNDHIKSVHVEKKMYLCPLCPMKFAAKHIMAKHFLNHRNEEGFSCPHCSKFYESQEDMNWHIIKSHQEIVHKLSYKDEFYYHLRILEEDPNNKDREEPECIEENESTLEGTDCLQECAVIFRHQYSYSGIDNQPLKLWL